MTDLKNFLLKRVDSSSVAFFRMAFGAIMLWEVSRYFSHDWIERYYIDPLFLFTYDGFHWLQPWSGYYMYVHFLALGILAFCIAIGLWYRFTTILFFLGFTFVFLLDKSNYLNHFYLISLLSFLLIFIPANRTLSLDVALRPEIQSNTIPYWALLLLQFQIGVAYFFGGIAKLNWDWLNGEPMRMWLAARTDFPIIGHYFIEEWMVYFFSYSGLLLDLFIVPLLLWKPTRIWSFLAITAFHLMNVKLWNIGIFPWFMIAASTIFFEPDWFRRLWNKIPFHNTPYPTYVASKKQFNLSKTALICLGIFVFFQLILPFRHHLYKGNVNWNENGHRFSWHMKLRDKSSSGRFLVRNTITNEEWEVNPRKYLTKKQSRKMKTHPKMILQFANFLEKEYQKEDIKNIEIYSRIKCSLNGREKQWLVDPEINLLSISKFTPYHKWIVQLDEPLVNKLTTK